MAHQILFLSPSVTVTLRCLGSSEANTESNSALVRWTRMLCSAQSWASNSGRNFAAEMSGEKEAKNASKSRSSDEEDMSG